MDRILFVDDEELVLASAKRVLASEFSIESVNSGEQGLVAIRERGPFAAVVSDIRMPAMDGITFLRNVSRCAPATMRVILTGNADPQVLLSAINQAQAYRFLCKPCPAATMREALSDAVAQYRRALEEATRIEQAQEGTVRAFSQLLAIANPAAFGRTTRIVKLATAVAKHLGAQNARDIERAAMLSQLGCLAVPERILSAAAKGLETLSSEDRDCFTRQPAVAARILSKSPQLASLAAIVSLDPKLGMNRSTTSDSESQDLQLAVQILRAVVDFDLLATQGILPRVALARMAEQGDVYASRVVEALAHVTNSTDSLRTVSLNVHEIVTGMTLEQEVVTKDGRPLLKLGTKLTEPLIERLRMFSNNVGVSEPILVSTCGRAPGFRARDSVCATAG